MQVGENRVVTFEYTAVDEQGKLIESSRDSEPMCYLHGYGRIAPGLETALEGRSVGDSFSITLAPADAFGERDDSLLHSFSREELSGLGMIEPGMQLQASDDSGTRILTVSEVREDEVILDENHPLAGMTVSFDVKVVDVRDATEEELQGDGLFCDDDCDTCGIHDHDDDCGCGCGHHH